LGAVPAARLVTGPPGELFDYDELRRRAAATMTAVEVDAPLVVLGSGQTLDDLRARGAGQVVRRRRGGGGVVLIQPGDLWIDWWIPPADERWTGDVRASAIAAGRWWRDALARSVEGAVEVHEGALEGATAHRAACFAGRGPGEVFVNGRKAVGVAQWRVREGTLVTSVLPARPSAALVDLLAEAPPGLAAALDHHTHATLGLTDLRALRADLDRISGPWTTLHRRLSS